MPHRHATLLAVILLTACTGADRAPPKVAYDARGVTVFMRSDAPFPATCTPSPVEDVRARLNHAGFSLVGDAQTPHQLDVRVVPYGATCWVQNIEVSRGGVVADLIVLDGYSSYDLQRMIDQVLASQKIAAVLAAPGSTTKRRLAQSTSLLLLPLKQGTDVSQATLEQLSGYILGRLDQVEGLRAVGRDDIEATLGADKQRQALGCDAVACMAEIGGALGVELVMYGQVGRVGSKYNVNISVVRANDSRVIARTSVMTEGTEDAVVAQMDPMINELVDKLDARN